MRSIGLILSATVMVLGAGVVAGQTPSTGSGQATSTGSGQAYPSKPIRIFTGSVGGNNDATSRFIAQGITGPLGQPVIVEPRPSGTAPDIVAKAPPDGYTLMLIGDLVWLGPLLRGQTPPLAELAPISMLGSSPNILVVHPSLPVKSVKELIALAKARAGDLDYASSGVGGVDHLAGELFKSMTGVKMVWVPFKATPPTIAAVLGGEVPLWFANVSLVTAIVKAGRLRALAVTSAQPSVLAPGVPTLAASGLPGFDIVNTDQMYAPAKTPVAIINQLNREIVRFLRTPAAVEQYLLRGSEVIATTPEEHAATLKSRVTTIAKLIKDAGIKAD